MANAEIFTNNALSSLSVAALAGDATLTVQVADAAKFPSPVAAQQFRVTAIQANTGLKEIMICTARAANVLTVSRAQEGTAALAFAVGDIVAHRLTAGALAAIGLNPTAPTWVVIGSGGGAPAFQNSWAAFGAPFQVPSYSIDFLGFVHLRGLAKSGTVADGVPIFTLPLGFRPLADRIFAVNSAGALGVVHISSAGVVSATAGSNVSLALDGIDFLAGN